MKFLIVSSTEDIASKNLKKELLSSHKFIKKDTDTFKLNENNLNEIYFRKITKSHIFSNSEDINDLRYDQIIFLSKHSTLSNIKPKCMTVHSVGNWGKAELGGKDNTVVNTDPILIRELLLNLYENKPKEIKNYEVKQEATHHGPYLKTSCIFYEIGSAKDDWVNKLVSKYMIQILIMTLKDYDQKKIKEKNNWISAVGVGGSHYCTKFNKYTFNRNKKYCFGHVVPNYAVKLLEINPFLLIEAKKKSNAEVIIYEQDI